MKARITPQQTQVNVEIVDERPELTIIVIGQFHDPNRINAERSMVKSAGGKVFEDQAGNYYATFHTAAEILQSGLVSCTARHWTGIVPDGWMEV